ncbi:MAG: PPK2 family polyphosphate kinase [Bifidobacterium sp.]|nr:PPK2 family polyphosphate kinase [Bifidobacterium sp.]
MAKDSKDKDSKQDKAIRKAMRKAADQAQSADRGDSVNERLARAAKSSEMLSAVWSLPPQQRLMFHHGTELTAIDPGSTPGFEGDESAGEEFIRLSSSEIARYQRIMYANGVKGDHHRLLIVLQGMDASGKGGIVRHVFSQVDPMGIHYHGFGAPTKKERSHDFLWRIRKELPADGWISIFDRSQYEDLVMPQIQGTYDHDTVEARFGQVNEFERKLVADGCAIIKIFLVSSKAAQKRHFLKRLDDPTRYWKFDPSDLDARDRWDDYMTAWQGVFERTSTSWAPWYLVPADRRWYSRIVVSELLRTTMKNFNLTWPPLDVDRAEALERLAED